MFGFTRKTDYALVALAGLAEAAPNGGPGRLSARVLSERFGLPLPVLMNVLKGLVNGGLVSSTRGARGGYALARTPGGISVHDVVAAIEGPVQVMSCCDPEVQRSELADGCAPDCRIEVKCPITGSVRRLNQRIHEYLGEVTLADLMNDDDGVLGPVAPRVHELRFRPIAEGDR